MFITDYQRETRNFVEMAGNAKNLLKPDKMWTYICVFRGLHKIHKLVHKNQSFHSKSNFIFALSVCKYTYSKKTDFKLDGYTMCVST